MYFIPLLGVFVWLDLLLSVWLASAVRFVSNHLSMLLLVEILFGRAANGALRPTEPRIAYDCF
jgi:hypothetical protein